MTRDVVPLLVEATGDNAGRVHELVHGVNVIGRGSEATLMLDHPDVSRRHAQLDVGPSAVIVRDLGSKNGVLVDGQRLVDAAVLAHGQTISFGDLTLRLNHPAAQVSHALARAGETTVTATRTADERAPAGAGLLLPIAGVLLFGGLVAAMLLL
ncbi:MAG TPA: FHA domain-containing protein [Nannocystaceae bacterium]|nr:FHA domain-containing protein [Nannocystaceae bacterium]